jgi:hypothetical protein
LPALARIVGSRLRCCEANEQKTPICRKFLAWSVACGEWSAARLLPGVALRASLQTTEMLICRHFLEAGATGLEPATSGVTGRARGSMILYRMARKSLDSWEFGSTSNTGINDSACTCPTVPPHLGPIASSSVKALQSYQRDSTGPPRCRDRPHGDRGFELADLPGRRWRPGAPLGILKVACRGPDVGPKRFRLDVARKRMGAPRRSSARLRGAPDPAPPAGLPG